MSAEWGGRGIMSVIPSFSSINVGEHWFKGHYIIDDDEETPNKDQSHTGWLTPNRRGHINRPKGNMSITSANVKLYITLYSHKLQYTTQSYLLQNDPNNQAQFTNIDFMVEDNAK